MIYYASTSSIGYQHINSSISICAALSLSFSYFFLSPSLFSSDYPPFYFWLYCAVWVSLLSFLLGSPVALNIATTTSWIILCSTSRSWSDNIIWFINQNKTSFYINTWSVLYYKIKESTNLSGNSLQITAYCSQAQYHCTLQSQTIVNKNYIFRKNFAVNLYRTTEHYFDHKSHIFMHLGRDMVQKIVFDFDTKFVLCMLFQSCHNIHWW